MNTIFSRIATTTLSFLSITAAVAPTATLAQLQSKSGQLVVVEPRNLPEAAQLHGNSFLLHNDAAGRTSLYIEQQQGARLTTLDVSDPSRIKAIGTETLAVEGAYDFIRSLDDDTELIGFRKDGSTAVLNLKKPATPSLHSVSGEIDLASVEPLGTTGMLSTGEAEPAGIGAAIARDFQVLDLATAANPVVLATVKQVKHKVVNDATGTTFLLGAEGLTVIRQPRIEDAYNAQRNAN